MAPDLPQWKHTKVVAPFLPLVLVLSLPLAALVSGWWAAPASGFWESRTFYPAAAAAAAAVRVDGTADGSGSAAAPLDPLELGVPRRLEEGSERLVLPLTLVFVLLLAMASVANGCVVVQQRWHRLGLAIGQCPSLESSARFLNFGPRPQLVGA